MGIYVTKAKWQSGLQPIVRFFVHKRIHPDWFTYGALGLSLAASLSVVLAGSNRAWLWLVPPCVIMRLALNLMDGQVARELGIADTWGEVKNEFGDRVADAAIFLGFALSNYADPRLAALTLALILCVSYLGILGKAVGGERVYGGLFGKGDRMISLALFTLYPLVGGPLASFNVYLAVAALAASITIVQRLKIIYNASSRKLSRSQKRLDTDEHR